MNQKHFDILDSDIFACNSLMKKSVVRAKLSLYGLQRYISDFIFRKSFSGRCLCEEEFNSINLFLLNQGGTFKQYIYGICNRFCKIRGANVLVPGIGYGRNLAYLAAFKPSRIVCFDIFDYPEEWAYMKNEIYRSFGVEVDFYKGDFKSLPANCEESFDLIVTDAVLEHVKDMPLFIDFSRKYLKDRGLFYASFGPIWYGPGGDHLSWGREGLFDHLLLPEEEYINRIRVRCADPEPDSADGAFIAKNSLYSYLSVKDYLGAFVSSDFEKLLAYAKISTEAISYLRKRPSVVELLNEKGVPLFDRFCSGIALWMRKAVS
ncbi:MAG: class I SAM-dependent methyltransferase [Candidatus Omnitrophota bacterium]